MELADYDDRMEFAWWFLLENAANQNFTGSVIFSDKTMFSLDGGMNVQNLHTCAFKKTHAVRAHASQCTFRICIMYFQPAGWHGTILFRWFQHSLRNI